MKPKPKRGPKPIPLDERKAAERAEAAYRAAQGKVKTMTEAKRP